MNLVTLSHFVSSYLVIVLHKESVYGQDVSVKLNQGTLLGVSFAQ